MNSSKNSDFKVFIVPPKRLSEVDFKILPRPLELEILKFSILGGGEGWDLLGKLNMGTNLSNLILASSRKLHF